MCEEDTRVMAVGRVEVVRLSAQYLFGEGETFEIHKAASRTAMYFCPSQPISGNQNRGIYVDCDLKY